MRNFIIVLAAVIGALWYGAMIAATVAPLPAPSGPLVYDPQIASAIASGVAAQLAQDAARQAAWMSTLSLLITTCGALGLAWIGFKQASLQKTIVTLEQNTNSIKDALVKSVGEAEKAKGVLEEKERSAKVKE